MPAQPLVTCICPTFNRPALLAEAVYWFTRQDYPNRELLILNDAAHTLRCDVPGVRVINAPTRYPNLGRKYEALIREARGEVIVPWEDDDISLPFRLSQCLRRLGPSLYWNPRGSWYEDRGTIHADHTHGYCFNASAVRKSVFAVLTIPDTNAVDQWFHSTGIPSVHPTQGPHEWSYVYRWGVTRHLSGHPDMNTAYRGYDPGTPGVIDIVPIMRRDYLCDTQALLSSV